jgi:hypothetical protein
MFDTNPPWLSRLTLRGLRQTMAYRLPGIPWGIMRDDIEPTMRRWCVAIGPIVMQPYRCHGGCLRASMSS